jgi:hypothetical protein
VRNLFFAVAILVASTSCLGFAQTAGVPALSDAQAIVSAIDVGFLTTIQDIEGDMKKLNASYANSLRDKTNIQDWQCQLARSLSYRVNDLMQWLLVYEKVRIPSVEYSGKFVSVHVDLASELRTESELCNFDFTRNDFKKIEEYSIQSESRLGQLHDIFSSYCRFN